MAIRNRPHITVPSGGSAEEYSPASSAREGKSPPSCNRVRHGGKLKASLEVAVGEAKERKESQGDVRVEGAVDGIYIEFESVPGFDLALTSLEDRRRKSHPELRAVKDQITNDDGKAIQMATVFVPNECIGDFVRKFEEYIGENTRGGQPRHRNLVERTAALRLATIEAMWTDPPEHFPDAKATVWWELWLRRRKGVEERLSSFAEQVGVTLGQQRLIFEDRVVVLAYASAEQLSLGLDVLDDLAELRLPATPMHFLADLSPAEQAEFVAELASRVVPPDGEAYVTCILDTGVAQSHPLIRPGLSPNDMHVCNPMWSMADLDGHGTMMAGPALYGDVGQAMVDSHPVQLSTRLESVKVLPDLGKNDPELHGALMAQATALVEITHPERRRSFVMAITHENGDVSRASDLGEPTGWSAAIDALAAGREVDVTAEGLVYLDTPSDAGQRLFILSAGNVRDSLGVAHIDRSDVEPVEDPAQSWNALTVGAYTEMNDLSADRTFAGWRPLAASGELSPFSRTSVGFRDQWPHKPDVVLEGGNAAVSPDGHDVDTPGALQILTTRSTALGARLLTTACGTSPATAALAHLVSEIGTQYSHLWPETIRALVVHSARWSELMNANFQQDNRHSRVTALRRYGWGIPDRGRALRSAANAVTMIVQDRIHPYDNGKMREMHVHMLPWPVDILTELAETEVEMRVALSYFIEPNPARRGWVSRFRYASHGLRFDVRRPTETTSDFRKRLNRLARSENESKSSSVSDANEWLLGPIQRVRGSLHVDQWRGSAADLASRGCIAVYPVTGWWKEQRQRDRSQNGVRYSLVVSIETPEVGADIWTPVAMAAELPVTIETNAAST